MHEPGENSGTFAVNGVDLCVDIKGDGEPLVLLHGGGGASQNWSLIFDAPPPGFCTIAPDLRGHGRSTNPSGAFSIRQCALDVLALLDGLDVDRFKAIGVSLGAKTLLHVATMQPARVEAMVIASATPYFPPQARSAMAQLTVESRTPQEWSQMRAWHVHGDAQIEAVWRAMRGLKDSYTDMNFTPPLLSTISARTLVVHGDRDPLYPVELAVEMYRAIPRASLWIVPGGGHGPIFGAQSAPFRSAALAFLREGG